MSLSRTHLFGFLAILMLATFTEGMEIALGCIGELSCEFSPGKG